MQPDRAQFDPEIRSGVWRILQMTAPSPKTSASLPASKPYRVVVADDHAVVRRGVRELLEMQPGIEVAAASPRMGSRP